MSQFNGIDVAVNVDVNGVPIALATAGGQTAMTTAVNAVTAAIQAQTDLTALFVTDGNGNFYVRREVVNEGTGAVAITFLNLDGSIPSTAPTVANLRPVTSAANNVTPVTAVFDVVTAATGYAIGDVLMRVLFVNTSTQAVSAVAWYNLTQGTLLASNPAAANIVEQDQNTKVTGTVVATIDGADPTSPPQANLGTGSRGWLATIAALLRLGTATKANSASVTVATDQGNLEPGGTAITGAAMPAGGVGLTGWLSAIWSAVNGTGAPNVISTAALGAGATSSAIYNTNTSPTGNAIPYAYLNATAGADQAGTLFVERSTDAVTFYPANGASGQAVAANSNLDLKVPVLSNVTRVRFVNGSTAQTKFFFAMSPSRS